MLKNLAAPCLKTGLLGEKKAEKAHEEAGSFMGKGLAVPHAAARPRAPAPARAGADFNDNSCHGYLNSITAPSRLATQGSTHR